MKVLHFCTDFWPSTGGIERFVLDLARHSRELGLDARVLCLNRIHGSSRILPATECVQGVPVRRIPFIDLLYYKPVLPPTSTLGWADVVHVHGIGGPLDATALTRAVHQRPIVLSTHGGIFHTRKLAGLKNLYFRHVHRLIQRAVACTVACSPQDYELFRPVARRLELIENGVELKLLRQWPISPRHPGRFIFVGRLARSKGLTDMLQLLALVVRQRPEAHLRIIGRDWEGIGPELLREVARLGLAGHVELLGQRSDEQVREELGHAAFFISASRYEGFGISAIEAMAAGCVPLLSDIPAFRSLIRDGENGLLLDYQNLEHAAARVVQVMAGAPGTMACAARTRAEDFAWERKMPRWVDLYREVAGRRVSSKMR